MVQTGLILVDPVGQVVGEEMVQEDQELLIKDMTEELE